MKTKFALISLIAFYSLTQAQTIKDIEGNIYNTISIGNQIWMKENLKTSHLNDGSSINLVETNNDWGDITSPGYCWYNDSLNKYKESYGALYNWYAASSINICPIGWHVPTDHEWSILISFLGGPDIAGGKLRETGVAHWKKPNFGADNSSNFTALPGGYRSTDGTFIPIGAFDAIYIGGGWWSNTEKDFKFAWSQTTYFNNSKISKASNFKTVGLSIRCLQDIKSDHK